MTDGSSPSGRRGRRRSRGNRPSPLVDSGAAEKLSAAAEAVGLERDQLVSLVSDSGLLAIPPSDGVGEQMSLEDLGKRLWNLSTSKPKGERAEWFAALVPAQQQALLTVLRDRGYATAVIAQEFGIDPMMVVEAYNKFADNLGARVTNVRMNTIAGQMVLAMERAAQMAIENEDAATFWRINKEGIQMLQSLGIVDRAAQKVEIDSKVQIGVDEKRAEIARIVELARREDQRRLEIEQSEREDDNAIRGTEEALDQEDGGVSPAERGGGHAPGRALDRDAGTRDEARDVREEARADDGSGDGGRGEAGEDQQLPDR